VVVLEGGAEARQAAAEGGGDVVPGKGLAAQVIVLVDRVLQREEEAGAVVDGAEEVFGVDPLWLCVLVPFSLGGRNKGIVRKLETYLIELGGFSGQWWC
jgi:hypothetical protein